MAILGIDEVGRGPWAGPLVVGAVVLCGRAVEGLTDSKKLTAKRRGELAREIYESGAGVGLGWVGAGEIDKLGLAEALRLATRRAVEEVEVAFHEIIIDGTVNLLAGTALERYVSVLPKADLLIPEVSAASIVAKVARDRYMVEAGGRYPGYGFERHVGYGTRVHMEALRKLGVTAEHRRSFRPVAEVGGGREVIAEAVAAEPVVNTKRVGDKAEEKVAEYLGRLGHEVVGRNWKTKLCEIDIISRDAEHLYFTEVKYRRSGERGGGLEAVTAEKRRRMGFAAESYMKRVGATRLSPVLAVAAVSGADFTIEDWFVLTESRR